MQRYGVSIFNATISEYICVNNMLYNIYLIFSTVFYQKTAVFYGY